jgi:hypothetical protein
LSRADQHPESEYATLTLDHRIEPGPGYAVWIWVASERPRRVNVVGHEAFQWLVSSSELSGQVMAWAISYDGVRQGSRWLLKSDNHSEDLLSSGLTWLQVAKWIRWFRAPFLRYEWMRSEIKERVSNQPIESLSAWLPENSEIADGALFEYGDKSGVALVREFLWDWIPGSEQAAEALLSLKILPSDFFQAVSKGADRLNFLVEASPVLFASMIVWGLGQFFYHAKAKDLVPVCCKVRNQCTFGIEVGSRDSISDLKWRDEQDRLLFQAGRDLGGVERSFLERVFKTARQMVNRSETAVSDRESLRLALSNDSFRRWSSAQLIHEFLQKNLRS